MLMDINKAIKKATLKVKVWDIKMGMKRVFQRENKLGMIRGKVSGGYGIHVLSVVDLYILSLFLRNIKRLSISLAIMVGLIWIVLIEGFTGKIKFKSRLV